MNRFCTFVVLSLLTAACGNADDGTLKSIDGLGGAGGSLNPGGAGGALGGPDAGQGGAGQGGSDVGTGGTAQGGAGGTAPQGGAGGSDVGQGGSHAGRGGSGQGGAGGVEQGGTGGSVGGQGGSNVSQGGSNQGGSGGAAQGGAGGSGQGGTGGSDQGGVGGSDQGGAGGSDVGQGGSDQGGAGGTNGEPEPECEGEYSQCDGNVYEACEDGVYFSVECSAEVGLNCYPGEGCYGDCHDGDARCTGDVAETCVHGEWTPTEACAFQCVAGACEGSCTPGTKICGEGATTLTCGVDFQYAAPAACPTDPNATASCSAGVCTLTPIPCGPGTADCDGNWSCEADLSSVETCGSCNTACNSAPANAAPTCTASGCSFTCNDGFADCDGNPANGCEQNTATDALNCGACGNSCYGTECEAGACEFDFEVVSDYSGENTRVRDLIVTDTYVYWQTETEIRRAAKAGGTYETFATLVGTPTAVYSKTAIVVDVGLVAWITKDGIYLQPESGGTPTRILQTPTDTTYVRSLVASDGKLYWNASQIELSSDCLLLHQPTETQFLKCSQDKRTTFYSYNLTSRTFGPRFELRGEYSTPLGANGTELYAAHFEPYFPNSQPDYRIHFRAYDATTGSLLRTFGGTFKSDSTIRGARYHLAGHAITDDTLIYATYITPSGNGIMTAPLSETNPVNSNAQIADRERPELTADGTAVYFRHGDDGTRTAVHRISLTGEPLAPIFESQTRDFIQIAVDDNYVYFTAYTTGGEQAILRAPK